MYQNSRVQNLQALRKEIIGELFGKLFKFAPPPVQNLYNGLNYNKAIRTLQSNETLHIEKICAAKTIKELTQRYTSY